MKLRKRFSVLAVLVGMIVVAFATVAVAWPSPTVTGDCKSWSVTETAPDHDWTNTAHWKINGISGEHARGETVVVPDTKFDEARTFTIKWYDAQGQVLDTRSTNGARVQSDCVDYEITQECGLATATITRNDTAFPFGFDHSEGSEDFSNPGAPVTPNIVSFPEDYNGGSVDVFFYIVGPEQDFVVGHGYPSYVNGASEKVAVDTDCEEPLPAFEIEVGQDCGVVTASITDNNTGFAGQLSVVLGSDVPLLNDYPWADIALAIDQGESLKYEFPEDYNGGEVIVTIFAHGPEQDTYAEDGKSPYFQTLTVDTDCKPEETTTTTTTPVDDTTTTTIVEDTTTTTVVPPVTTPEPPAELPFTGFGATEAAIAALILALTGGLLVRKNREQTI